MEQPKPVSEVWNVTTFLINISVANLCTETCLSSFQIDTAIFCPMKIIIKLLVERNFLPDLSEQEYNMLKALFRVF